MAGQEAKIGTGFRHRISTMENRFYTDRNWMYKPRNRFDRRRDADYIQGIDYFIKFALNNSKGKEIMCPCIKCENKFFVGHDIIEEHLILYGFFPRYTLWRYHGESDHYDSNARISTLGLDDDVNQEIRDVVMRDESNDMRKMSQDQARKKFGEVSKQANTLVHEDHLPLHRNMSQSHSTTIKKINLLRRATDNSVNDMPGKRPSYNVGNQLDSSFMHPSLKPDRPFVRVFGQSQASSSSSGDVHSYEMGSTDERISKQVEDSDTSHKVKRHTRGRTSLKAVAPRNGEKHKCIVYEDGRVAGPGRRSLSNYLGISARNHNLFPIHKEWGKEHDLGIDRVMVDVHRAFEFVNVDGTKLRAYNDVITFVKKTINQQLRNFRARLKSKLDPNIFTSEQLQTLDDRVPQECWVLLIEFWSKQSKRLQAGRNKRSRSVSHATNTSGPISFAEKQHKASKEGEDVIIRKAYPDEHKKNNKEYRNEKRQDYCGKEMNREFGVDKTKNRSEPISDLDDESVYHHRGYEKGTDGDFTRRVLNRKSLIEESNRIAATWLELQEKERQIQEKNREIEYLHAQLKLLQSEEKSTTLESGYQTDNTVSLGSG